jgi:hypothetical protein
MPAAVVLAGCQTTTLSSYEFDEFRVFLSSSKENREQYVRDCAKRRLAEPVSEQKAKALITGVSMEKAPRVYCQRIADGVISGRYTYNDYASEDTN